MQHTLHFSAVIARPPELVYAHMANPRNLLGLQPLLTSMSPIRETTRDGHAALAYETVETFRLWGVPLLRNRIAVETVLRAQGRRIESYVHSRPGITLAVGYDFAPAGGGTRLTEQMQIDGPRLVLPFVVRQATAAQEAVLANLKARLEGLAQS